MPEGSSLALLGVLVSVSFPSLPSELLAPSRGWLPHLDICSELGPVLAPIDFVIILDVAAILGLETEAQRGEVTCLGSHS